MKYPIYAIRDNMTSFRDLMLDINDNSAKRNFARAINTPGSLENYSAKDFDLYKLGEFDVESGHIVSKDVPEMVCSGSSVVGSEAY